MNKPQSFLLIACLVSCGGVVESEGQEGGSSRSTAAGGLSNALMGTTTASGGAPVQPGSAQPAASGGVSPRLPELWGAGGTVGFPQLGISTRPVYGCAELGIMGPTACTADDPQSCHFDCNDEETYRASVHCVDGAYVASICSPTLTTDASCFMIPAEQSSSCPAEILQSGSACDIPACTTCSFGATHLYLNEAGQPQSGYCTCAAGTLRCQSEAEWPCPGNVGCG